MLTASVILLCMMVTGAAAEENTVRTTACAEPEYHLAHNVSWDYRGAKATLEEFVSIDELKKLLLDCISSAQQTVDISSVSLPVEAQDALLTYIFYCLPEAFNVHRIVYSSDNEILCELSFSYRDFADTAEEYAECFSEMKKTADELLDGIENNPSLDDVTKALLLHDRLCVINEYKYKNVEGGDHTAYAALVNRASVCQGYAMAYMYLLDRVGIENYYCVSDKLNHAWNIIYINDEAYHVDVTWDDISWSSHDGGAAGALGHEYFLRSTNGLKEEKHNASDFDSYPTDTTYDDYYWQCSESEFQLIGNSLYYIDSENGKLMCADEGSELADVTDVWRSGANGHWIGNFARLSSAGSELLYSLSDGIYKYCVQTGKNEKIYSPSLPAGFSVFGFTYEDGNLVIEINKAPPYGNTTELYSEKIGYTDINHILYKIDVDMSDAKRLYFAGEEFDPQGIKIILCYTDKTTGLIDSGITFSGFDSEEAGEKTVVAEYEGFMTEFTVKVLNDRYFPGDVDGDGKITSADARLALRAAVGLDETDASSQVYKAANIISGDSLTSADARVILRIAVGLEKLEDRID